MLTQDFESTANEIVEKCFPEHSMFWSVNGDNLTNLVEKNEIGTSESETIDHDAEFRFGGEIVPILQGASAVAGLVSSLIVIYNNYYKNKIKPEQTDMELIADQLKSSGVAADKTVKIIELLGKFTK